MITVITLYSIHVQDDRFAKTVTEIERKSRRGEKKSSNAGLENDGTWVVVHRHFLHLIHVIPREEQSGSARDHTVESLLEERRSSLSRVPSRI